MKKLIASLMSLAVLVWVAGPLMAVAISTGLTQDASGGTAPSVLVSWVARGDAYTNPTDYYRDNDSIANSQILPSGQYNTHRNIAMCAIVASEYGIEYINNVYADVFYPGVKLGAYHTALPNQSGKGCGQFMQQDLLNKLAKQVGIDLFCTNVQQNNGNLPSWNSSDSYSTLCGTTGKLYKDEAVVYCGTKVISYEDPAGYYPITTLVQDKNGQSGVHNHGFQYLGVNAFEVDFNQISYGNVKLNINKVVGGDLTFSPMNLDKPSIRNVGNVRLTVGILQNDMNLGKSSGQWNVSYGARIGHLVTFTPYSPEETKIILDELDLSQLNEMDFSVLVNKFPYPVPSAGFIGSMTLSSAEAPFVVCTQ